MKLSELVFYKEKLKQFSCVPSQTLVDERLKEIIDGVNQSPVELDQFKGALESDLVNIQSSFSRFEQSLDSFKQYINDEISKYHRDYFNISYSNYNDSRLEPIENIRDRELRINDDDLHLLKHRLRLYSDWHHAGMLIRPTTSELFKEIVDCDPFYIVDIDHELLKPCLESVNPIYAGRLRTVVFDDRRDTKISAIPRNQIGFVFAWNFFNYKPLEVIKEYLQNLIEILKPGGTLLMTFNDCDRSLPVKLVENAFASYTPGDMLVTMAQSMGYDVVYRHQGAYHCNWLELKRPGRLTSMRGGQSLAKICRYPLDDQDLLNYNVTKPANGSKQEEVANTQEAEVRNLAQKLGIVDWNKSGLDELREQIKTIQTQKELQSLRRIALNIKLDSADRIMNQKKWPLEKLREEINLWRKNNERSST